MRPRLTYAQKSVLLQLVNHGDMQPADGNQLQGIWGGRRYGVK